MTGRKDWLKNVILKTHKRYLLPNGYHILACSELTDDLAQAIHTELNRRLDGLKKTSNDEVFAWIKDDEKYLEKRRRK